MTDASQHVIASSSRRGRLDAVLAELLPLSRSRLKALILAGQVSVDGEVAQSPRHKLIGGEAIVVHEPAPPPSTLVAQDLGVPMLHIDEHVVVVDKPADMVVHPAKGHPDRTLVNGLLHLIAEARIDAGPFPTPPARPGVVHRLDRGTSGVLVVARTPAALTHLAAQFAAHTVTRAYCALVWGETPGRRGTIDAALARHPKDRIRFAVNPDGKRAVTHWTRLAEARFDIPKKPNGGVVSLIECVLETGRTHQIRVHLHHLGLPLVGDPLYGRRRGVPAAVRDVLGKVDRQLLHAGRLGFDTLDGDRRHFERPPPPDFQAALQGLGLPIPFSG